MVKFIIYLVCSHNRYKVKDMLLVFSSTWQYGVGCPVTAYPSCKGATSISKHIPGAGKKKSRLC